MSSRFHLVQSCEVVPDPTSACLPAVIVLCFNMLYLACVLTAVTDICTQPHSNHASVLAYNQHGVEPTMAVMQKQSAETCQTPYSTNQQGMHRNLLQELDSVCEKEQPKPMQLPTNLASM